MLFEQLKDDEIVMLEEYIDYYAFTNTKNGVRTVSLEHLLRIWEKEKEPLFHMFGDKLILSKEVLFRKEDEELEDEFDELTSDIGNPCREFLCKYNNLMGEILTVYTDEWYEACGLISFSSLSRNTYEGDPFQIPLKNGKSVKVQKGSKIMKILGKIADSYGIDGFEDFRIAHSQILNQKYIKGNLCLSIHPLDYMTMSDNECGWESCMSWTETGYYRQGTVEMMNSPLVVVAYLTSEERMPICFYAKEDKTLSWNSKKWRELFIVDKDIITNVKAYPYRNWSITRKVLDWLKELAERANLGKYTNKAEEYPAFSRYTIKELDKTVNISPLTGMMYNDFNDHQMGYFNVDIEEGRHEIIYSGEPECMSCGATDELFEDESFLACQRCSGNNYICDCCGQTIYSSSGVFYIDGEGLCADCYDENTYYDVFTGERHLEENMRQLYVSFDQGKTIYSLGQDCLINYEASISHDDYKRFYKQLYIGSGDWVKYYFIMAEDLTDRGLFNVARVETSEELKEKILNGDYEKKEIFTILKAPLE